MNGAAATALAAGVAAEFRRRVLGEYVPRIRRCVELLGEDRCWQRPAPNCNSVANLLQHLAGNTAQWILATFARAEDRRNRPFEFASTREQVAATAAELMAALAAVAARASDVVDGLSVEDLLRAHTIQQRYTESGLSAVLHVMEHFSGHAGQIYAWTKQATGRDLEFYDL